MLLKLDLLSPIMLELLLLVVRLFLLCPKLLLLEFGPQLLLLTHGTQRTPGVLASASASALGGVWGLARVVRLAGVAHPASVDPASVLAPGGCPSEGGRCLCCRSVQ